MGGRKWWHWAFQTPPAGYHVIAPSRGADVVAVDGVSLSVTEGEMIGYGGPNGAGKSTTIKMLTGILRPSGGYVRVAGLDPAHDRLALARRIGVVFGRRTQLW